MEEGKPAEKSLQLLNVFAHDIQVVLTQWPLPDKKGEPTVLKDNLAALVSKYPGLRLLMEMSIKDPVANRYIL